VVIDTVADVVLGDVGKDIVNTAGVAVRPFWWSTECLQTLGVSSSGSGSEDDGAGAATTAVGDAGDQVGTGTTGGDGLGDGSSAGDAVDGDSADAGSGDQAADGGQSVEGQDVSAQSTALSGGWIALIVVLGLVAVGSLAALAYLLGQGRRAPVAASASAPATASASAPGTEPDEAAFCSQCGRSLDVGGKFCPGCGRPL
jgi:hypothetical protein